MKCHFWLTQINYFGGKSSGPAWLQVDFFILLPNASSKGSKVVSPLHKLNFDNFAENISQGTNVEVIFYPMWTAQQ